MKKILLLPALVIGTVSAAHAGVAVNIGFGVAPAYVPAPPVYCPAPVYCPPRVYVPAPPVVCAPAPVIRFNFGWGGFWGHRDWDHRWHRDGNGRRFEGRREWHRR